MFILHHFEIGVYASFDVIRRQASMTQAEKFPDPFCSRAMLICSIIWRVLMLRVVVLRVLSRADMRLPVFSVADLYCLEVVLMLLMTGLMTIPAS